MADTWRDVITDALYELNVYGREQSIAAADEQFALRKLNAILNMWEARSVFAYNQNYALYTLTPNHQPHTIGPSAADFAVTSRPVRIENAAIVIAGASSPVDIPLKIRDDDWWAGQRVKSITSTIPTSLYYSPDFPNGSLYLWPIPTQANGLRLETWVTVGQVTDITADFVAPPGYKLAITLTLAEHIAGPFGATLTPLQSQMAVRARSAVQGLNATSPRVASADWGTRGKSRGGGFNYLTGGPA